MSGASVAVTGASGFVGRHLVPALAAAGHAVSGLVRSERAARVVREAGGRAVPMHDEPVALAREVEGCRSLVHLAQIGAERDGQTYEAVNVGLTARVVEAARIAGVRSGPPTGSACDFMAGPPRTPDDVGCARSPLRARRRGPAAR